MAVKLDKETLIELFKRMLRARAFDEKAMDLFTKGIIPGFIHVGIGQEAVAAGVCLNLQTEDSIFVTHRGHAQCVAKGIDLKGAMAELMGKASGFCRGRGGSMHIYDKNVGVLGSYGIVGAGIPIATGVAYSYKLQGIKQVVVSFFGDGAVNHGTFHESLNMASLWGLPVIFCCENNGWAQFSAQAQTTKVTNIASKAKAYDIPSVRVDGDDVLAVYEAAKKAVERARKGEGPTFLECLTHRWYGHYVGDSQTYRTPEELNECRQFDPIPRLEAYLIEQNILSPDSAKEIRNKVKAEIEEAVQFAEQSPLPEAKEALEYVYFEGAK